MTMEHTPTGISWSYDAGFHRVDAERAVSVKRDGKLVFCVKDEATASTIVTAVNSYASSQAEIAKLKADRSGDVGIGMAIAAGIVLSSFGDDTIACEILGAAGLRTVGDMRKIGVETYDIRLCAPALRVFREKDRARKHRATLAEAQS